MNILIADDETLPRENLARFIELKTKSKVTEVSDGNEAWEILKTNNFEIIFSDSRMPKMDGISFLKKVRADERFKKILFIMISADSDDSFKNKAIAAGADDVFIKPFPMTKITDFISKFS